MFVDDLVPPPSPTSNSSRRPAFLSLATLPPAPEAKTASCNRCLQGWAKGLVHSRNAALSLLKYPEIPLTPSALG